jgi:hypothetical protein
MEVVVIFRYPAVCETCGQVSFSGIAIGYGARVHLSGNTSRCPRCGNISAVPDGVMDILERGIRIFSGPDFTVEVLRALQMAVEDLRSGAKTPEQAESSLAAHHLGLAQEFRAWWNCGANTVQAMATVAAAVFTFLTYQNSNRTLEEVAVEAFEEIYVQPQVDTRISNSWTDRPRPTENPAAEPPFGGTASSANADTSPPSLNRKQRLADKARARQQAGANSRPRTPRH